MESSDRYAEKRPREKKKTPATERKESDGREKESGMPPAIRKTRKERNGRGKKIKAAGNLEERERENQRHHYRRETSVEKKLE